MPKKPTPKSTELEKFSSVVGAVVEAVVQKPFASIAKVLTQHSKRLDEVEARPTVADLTRAVGSAIPTLKHLGTELAEPFEELLKKETRK